VLGYPRLLDAVESVQSLDHGRPRNGLAPFREDGDKLDHGHREACADRRLKSEHVFHLGSPKVMTASLQESARAAVTQIVQQNGLIARMWGHELRGWATGKAGDLLRAARLDRQVALSRTLQIWLEDTDDSDSDGRLIMAWANLGALVEATLTWFL